MFARESQRTPLCTRRVSETKQADPVCPPPPRRSLRDGGASLHGPCVPGPKRPSVWDAPGRAAPGSGVTLGGPCSRFSAPWVGESMRLPCCSQGQTSAPGPRPCIGFSFFSFFPLKKRAQREAGGLGHVPTAPSGPIPSARSLSEIRPARALPASTPASLTLSEPLAAALETLCPWSSLCLGLVTSNLPAVIVIGCRKGCDRFC